MPNRNLLPNLLVITEKIYPYIATSAITKLTPKPKNTHKLSVVKFCLLLAAASTIISIPAVVISPETAFSRETFQIAAWQDVFNLNTLFHRQRRRSAARGTNNFCPISPGIPNETTQIWSDRPLFIWQGQIQNIIVRTSGSDTDDLWNQPIVENQQSTTYAGAKLQPGQTYEWIVYRGDNPFPSVSFQVMETQQRDRITTEVQTLEQQLQTKGATKEAIALAKAQYFANLQLWSDALQQAYSVAEPSPELQQIRLDIAQNLCKTNKNNS
ncbi:DUF928 domain-containing protein [Tolypothrix sp. LEGE 11397]|nr:MULTISPECIES: DUF928 domain-containing protein [unclassified Tolypothrix]BAY89470.1 hypothetical protein NIES3275_14730 [Microchaete diplosiphon NIES-3275]EKF01792.1 hypothetical protein FDUTEX481_07397 [Tolypothrix sp. PCC 7601]MBE9086350.1 DUF928 domain-containing protein [Tolypothrix sp. LEGE 11397]UYD23757.1 DUF928 domain-containing protein [Tolypothrix sp. PCC 7712]UYD34018.1 DUF928 domain-containing protein [Tolypothrix sp. PCC 7601]